MQELLGHADVSTTMIYTHVLKVGGMGVRSPLDVLARAMAPPAPPGFAVRGSEPTIPADVHRLAVRPAEGSGPPALA